MRIVVFNKSLMYLWNKLYELFFWKIHYFKDEPFVEFEIRLTLNYCIFQRVILEMALESAILRQKSPHIFSDPTH